jgi:hypothetical protein
MSAIHFATTRPGCSSVWTLLTAAMALSDAGVGWGGILLNEAHRESG